MMQMGKSSRGCEAPRGSQKTYRPLRQCLACPRSLLPSRLAPRASGHSRRRQLQNGRGSCPLPRPPCHHSCGSECACTHFSILLNVHNYLSKNFSNVHSSCPLCPACLASCCTFLRVLWHLLLHTLNSEHSTIRANGFMWAFVKRSIKRKHVPH